MKKALITGVAGQDGLYMSRFLLKKGYEVHGMIQREAHLHRELIDPIKDFAKKNGLIFELCYGDLGETTSLYKLLSRIEPDEIYNFASQSHVQLSHEEPEITTKVNANGVLSLLEAVRFLKLNTKFYQACSSELFGDPKEVPQTEATPFCPKNPYAISKLYSYWISRYYRDYHKIFTSNGILFNHESPYRGENFVTRKITYSLARIKAGLQEKLFLGNYDSERDWGFAGDYVEAMWLMLQHSEPDDFVIASGENHSVREFVELAFNYVGIKDWEKYVISDKPEFMRPAEVDYLIGDYSKAKKELGWTPKTSFKELVDMMVKSDVEFEKKNP